MGTAGYLRFDTKLDTNGFQKGINQITATTKRGGGTIKNIVAGLGIAKLASVGLNAIRDSIGGAIKRFDTLKNFPRVMESLGYSTEQASKSMKTLDKGIEGLPTTMDEIVRNTQLLTSSLGDLDKGSKTAVALNDMFLAGGQGAEAASRALVQYNQMLARGKVSQQEWNTIVEVAPGQINQVARSLLGASANQKDLYAALQDGTISMQDFNNEIIKLDQQGGKGFASFAEQAKSATGGIATSIQNIRTAIVKNIANIIDSINKKLEELGLGTIQQNLEKVKNKINEFGETATRVIPQIIEMIYRLRVPIIAVITAIALAKLAMAGFTAGKNILGIIQSFQQARIQASLYTMEVGKASVAQILFNKDLNNTEKAFTILKNTKLGDTFSKIGQGAQSGAKGVLSFLSAHKGLAIGLGVAGLAIGGMIALYKKAGGDAGKMSEMITDKVNQIVEVIQNIASKLPQIVSTVIPKIIQTISTVLPQIITTITQAIPQIIPVVVNAAITLVNAVIGAIPILVPPLINGLIQIFLALVNALPTLIPLLINGAIQLIMALVEALPTIIQALISALPTIIIAIVTGILNALPILIKGAIELVFGLVRAIPQIIAALIKEMPRIVRELAQGLINAGKHMRSAGVQLIRSLWQGFKSWVQNLFNNVKNFAKSIPGKIKEGIGNLGNIGRDMVRGLWNGINNAKDWILSRIRDFAGLLPKAIKKILKIGSPSKLMADDVGRWIPAGVALGIDKNKKVVLKSIKSLSDEMVDKMAGAVNFETGNMNASANLKSNASFSETLVLNATFDGQVDIDGKKAGRILAPEITKTIKVAGGR